MHPIRRTVLAATALVLASALALAGCSGTASSTKGGHNATARIGLVLEPTSLNIRTQSGSALDQVLIDNVYQGLVGRTANGKIKNVLATTHTMSDDGRTYTFSLHTGVRFDDGTTLTAADVVWSLNDFRQHANTYVNGTDLSSVTSVTAPDQSTVVITVNKPDSDLLWNLSGRAGLVLEHGATNDLATTANGTGPYTVASWKQGDSLTFARNKHYWGTKAKVAKIIFRYITQPSTAVNAMANGDLDVETAVDGTLKSQLANTSGISLHTGKTTDKYTLAFNNAVAPLNDVRVRRAIRQAIDNRAIIKAVGGTGVEQGGPIPALDPGYQDLTDIDTYNPKHAKQLLAAAGKSSLSLTLTYANVYPSTLGDVLKSQLAKVGITLTVKRVDFATWLSSVFTKPSDGSTRDYQLSLVNHTEAHDFGNWANPSYYFGYNNPTVQKLYEASKTATNVDERNADLAKAARIVSNDAAADWLYTGTTTTAIRSGVTGFPTTSTTSRLNLAKLAVS